MTNRATSSELLRPVDLKLRRASQHHEILAKSISDWTTRNPIRTRSELRDGRLGFRLILDDFHEPAALEEWGLLLGDFAHNVRSALDNLAFALARLTSDPPERPNRIAFPICEERAKFDAKVRKSLGGLPSDAALLIEKLQPFQRTGSQPDGKPSEDPLLLLHALNNADKHRVPPVALIAPRNIGHGFMVAFHSNEDAAANVPPDQTIWAGPLSKGVVLVEHRTTRPIKSAEGRFEIRAVVVVEMLGKQIELLPAAAGLGRYVSDVVARFRPWFMAGER